MRSMARVWDFVKWKGLDHVTCWNNHSELIHGSDALQFQPGRSLNDSVYVFVGELFRVAKLNATEEVCTVPFAQIFASPL